MRNDSLLKCQKRFLKILTNVNISQYLGEGVSNSFLVSGSSGLIQSKRYLLGLLHGDAEGLDCREFEANELVLRLLSGLLREHTLSMDTLVFLQASHPHSPLHLLVEY